MPVDKKQKQDNSKRGKKALVFNSYLDDFFGLIILVLVLLVFIGSFFFVWYPRLHVAMDRVLSTTAQLDNEKSHLEIYRDSIIKYKKVHEDVSQDDIDKINDMIGPWGQHATIYHVDLLMTFQELLYNDNFSLISVDTSEAAVSPAMSRKVAKVVVDSSDNASLPQGIMDIRMDLEIEDVNYNDLKEILFLLERKLRLVDVLGINFSPDNETCSIELATYRFDSES